MRARDDRGTTAREETLARLRAAAREAPDPAPWTSTRRFEDLAGRFVTSLADALGEAHRAHGPEEVRRILGRVLDEAEAKSVVADEAPELEALGLPGVRPDVLWQTPGALGDGLREACAAAGVGVSLAEAGLAETGTVVLAMGHGRSRLGSLLPPVHVVLLPRARLVDDLFAWTTARPDPLPSQLVLVSGPSKTADIEQTLAVGVHGPGRLVVILYEEA